MHQAATFRLGGARVITIAEGKTTKSETITIDPLETDAATTNIFISVEGEIIGANATSNPVTGSVREVVIVDNDEGTGTVYLTVTPDTLKKGGGEQTVTVTAFLDGAPFPDHDLTILLSPATRDAALPQPATISQLQGVTRISI